MMEIVLFGLHQSLERRQPLGPAAARCTAGGSQTGMRMMQMGIRIGLYWIGSK